MRANENGLIPRIVKLETAIESHRIEFDEIRDSLREINIKVDKIAGAKPNYGLWVSIASLSAMVLLAVGSAAYVPIWITTNDINAKAQTAIDWENAYQRGLIPSAALPKITALEEKLLQLNGEFQADKKDMEDQVKCNKDVNDSQTSEINKLRERVGRTEQTAVAVWTRLEDHDKYLWPQIQSNTERTHK